MKATRGSIEFSTGKVVYIHAGIIGLCIAGDDECMLSLGYGYDGSIFRPEDTLGQSQDKLTPAECVELADEMLTQWAEFRARYAEPQGVQDAGRLEEVWQGVQGGSQQGPPRRATQSCGDGVLQALRQPSDDLYMSR